MKNEMEAQVEMAALNEKEMEMVAGGWIILNRRREKDYYSGQDSNSTTYAMKFMHEC